MKKDRNCGGNMPYPVYPTYQTGMMPMPGMPGMSISPFMSGTNMNSNINTVVTF